MGKRVHDELQDVEHGEARGHHGGTGLDFGQRLWMDANGNAIVAWQRPSGGTSSIVVNRFVKYC